MMPAVLAASPPLLAFTFGITGQFSFRHEAFAVPCGTRRAFLVRGGTAVTSIATRLSQGLPKTKILRIEAGPAAPNDARIHRRKSWQVLGGLSAMNHLCYDRASALKHEAWGELDSAGWGWNAMIDAMTKSENFTDDDRHGHKGSIRNYYDRVVYPVLRLWEPSASKFKCWSSVANKNTKGGDPISIMFQPTNVDTTQRAPAASPLSTLSSLLNSLSRRIANTDPINNTWTTETEPGSAVQTDDQVAHFCQESRRQLLRPVGTCAVLPKKDGGDVDADLRIYGTFNLRVVNMSTRRQQYRSHHPVGPYPDRGLNEGSGTMDVLNEYFGVFTTKRLSRRLSQL